MASNGREKYVIDPRSISQERLNNKSPYLYKNEALNQSH